MHTDGQTDRMKLIVNLCNFTNAPNTFPWLYALEGHRLNQHLAPNTPWALVVLVSCETKYLEPFSKLIINPGRPSYIIHLFLFPYYAILDYLKIC
jgi:hypothetical protein